MTSLQRILVDANTRGELVTMACPIDGTYLTMGAWGWADHIFPWMSTDERELYLSGVEMQGDEDEEGTPYSMEDFEARGHG